jgi:hypothetical protein
MTRRSPLPLRWDAGARPPDLPVTIPPAGMAPLRGRRPLKRWRYVAAFCDELMLCAAVAAVGPARSSWWAVWDRREATLHERTRIAPGQALVRFGDNGRLRVRDRGVTIDLVVDEGAAVESLNPHGAQHVWTRKQAGRPVAGRVTLRDARTIELGRDALAIVDDTAGYHARTTEWWWSAGVGETLDGAPVGWNLVSGVNDGPTASERSLWVAGVAREVAPVRIAGDLSAVAFATGEQLRFGPEAVRARHDRLLLVASEYRQPFGTFTGALPGAGALQRGLGVMEHHRARW